MTISLIISIQVPGEGTENTGDIGEQGKTGNSASNLRASNWHPVAMLTHALIHRFEAIAKKLQTTIEMWSPIKGSQDTDCIENIVEKGEIAHIEQFLLFPQCFPIAF